MHTPATFTLSFSGPGYDSVWFTPIQPPAEGAQIDENLFSAAQRACKMAKAMLECGCAMATRVHPELTDSLAALALSPLSVDFFNYTDTSNGLGWFRMTGSPNSGSTPEALAACEQALMTSHAPFMSAKANGDLLAFTNGSTNTLPFPFIASAHEATERVTQSFEQAGAGTPLVSADITILASADGSKKIAICVPSTSLPSDSLSDFKTFAKLAQSGIEARQAAKAYPESEAFFNAMDRALGAHPDSPVLLRKLVSMSQGAFFPMPESTRMVTIGGLPNEGFEDMSKIFMQSMSKRFGVLAASSRAQALFIHQGELLTCSEQASLTSLFSKLPSRSAPELLVAPPTNDNLRQVQKKI